MSSGSWSTTSKAFLFVLLGSDITPPCKIKLKDANDGYPVHLYGSAFGAGYDLVRMYQI